MVVDGFFQALADADEGNDRWDSLVAGLAALRAVESIVGGHDATLIHQRARDFTAKVANTTLRSLITGVLDVIGHAHGLSTDRADLLAQRLMGWGLWLHADAQYAPAADVFAAVDVVASDDPEARIQATYRRAFALRISQRFDAAERAYHHLIDLASAAHNHRMRLEGQLGLAKLVGNRGNIPASIPLVDAVAEEAERLEQGDVLRKCHLERAYIAGMRLQPAGVIQHSYLALDGMTDPNERIRVLINMAVAFRELGEAAASRTAAEFVMTQARTAEERILASLTRYHLAIDAEDWITAEALRKQLGSQKMSPAHAAELFETSARHFAARGDREAAMRMIERVLSIAEAEGLSEFLIRGDQALAEIRAGQIPVRYSFRPTRPLRNKEQRAVRAIAAAVPALCEA